MKIPTGNLQQIHLVVVEEVVMAAMEKDREADAVEAEEAVETAETKEVEEEDHPPAKVPTTRSDRIPLDDHHDANGSPETQQESPISTQASIGTTLAYHPGSDKRPADVRLVK
jgi:hypothetical protein